MFEDQMVDAFLNELPLSPMPSGFSRSVMERIKDEQKAIRFRLDFIDLAIPVFLALFATLVFSILMVIIVIIPPFWLVRLEMQVQPLLWSLPESTYLVASIVIGICSLCVIVALGFAGMHWLRPNTHLLQKSQV
ncbi:MAG: hypothetical protein EHM41_07130 [Chloroflexi bacterium]|nr:MAG: hypothetical protein EHM41_07130 [Chloroflexota bacterium]